MEGPPAYPTLLASVPVHWTFIEPKNVVFPDPLRAWLPTAWSSLNLGYTPAPVGLSHGVVVVGTVKTEVEGRPALYKPPEMRRKRECEILCLLLLG